MSQLVCVSPFYAPTPSNTIFLPDCHRLFLAAIIYSCICKPQGKAWHICMFLKTVPVSRCQWLINLSVDSFLFINKCKQYNYITGLILLKKKSPIVYKTSAFTEEKILFDWISGARRLLYEMLVLRFSKNCSIPIARPIILLPHLHKRQ